MTLVLHRRDCVPPFLFMKELSIFIDESGDFGNFEPHCRYYLVSFVFHDQAVDISSQVSVLDRKLVNLNIDHVVHTVDAVCGKG